MEAEYVRFSLAMQALIPMRHKLEEYSDCLGLERKGPSTIWTVWEDNQAAIQLASYVNPPRMTPRSKHMAIKYHWFRGHLK